MNALLWYCLNIDGMATLCAGKQEAEIAARGGDTIWPRKAPHRAVQLVELTPQLAAAGDVLEALRDAEARLTVAIDQDRHKLLDVVARDKARTAIAKATGGAA